MTATLFPTLFSEFRIRHVKLANRIVSTAHGTYMPRDGLQTDQIAAYHRARAQAGVGLIILEATSTHPTGIGAPQYATAHTDDCIPGYRRVIDEIHTCGVPVFVQLYHPGRDDIAGTTADGTRAPSYSASPALCETNQLMPRAMGRRLIHEVVASYGAAARRLIEAGADGIEISSHHGHLISQFLDPRVNQRTDEYGGDFAGRFRILREIVDSIRTSIGVDPILGVRLTCLEGSATGITTEEALETVVAADNLRGIDFIHITPGSTASFDGMPHVVAPMAYAAGYAEDRFRQFRTVISKPLIVTGRINDPAVAETILAGAHADCVGMTRALICDPELPIKAREGRVEDIRFCIACNQACIGHDRRGGFVSCIQNPAAGRELLAAGRRSNPERGSVLIAGGGPGGMKAAVVAAARGYKVTLYEREARLGGQARLAAMLPGREEFGGLITNLESELRRLKVPIILNQEVTAALVDREAPSTIVIATGAMQNRPTIPGEADMQVVHAWDVVTGRVEVGSSVIIADATLDWVALGVAEKLVREGRSVRICAQGFAAGENTPFGVRGHWLGLLHSLGVEVTPLMRLGGCDESTVFFQHAVSQETISFEGVDTLILSFGGIPDVRLEDALTEYRGSIQVIGDCLSPRTAEEAILEGFSAAGRL
jgi:2,4-dienoyl-CoA reductase-like NADH-dependent reductase (Old Yellow Enzyme family)